MEKIPSLRKKLSVILAIVLPLLLAGTPGPLYGQETLKIAGTGTAMGHMDILARSFMKANPHLRVTFVPRLGSTGAIKAVSRGVIDIAISARELTEQERGLGMTAREYARTPLVFATHKGVGLSGITHDEVVMIYGGGKTAWADGGRIRTIMRQHNEADMHIIARISPAMKAALEAAFSRPGMITALTDQDCADLLEKIPGAFGATTLTQVIAERRQVGVLNYNGVQPSVENLARKAYPLVRHSYTVTKKETSPAAQKFLAFMKSREGRKIITESGNLLTH